jgi:GNAT superfamily N-acetyltransferase
MLPDGYTILPPGKLAAAVTYLEITEFAPASVPAPPESFTLERIPRPPLGWYRELFRAVGSPWLWFGRLALSDAELAATLHDAAVEVYALRHDGEDVGLLELDARVAGEMELAYLGLVPGVIGRGAGRFLLESAIARATAAKVRRLWVHTCSFDHPDALRIYQRAGFRPCQRAIEVFDDPRLTGILPLDAAPQIPLIVPAHDN